MSLFPNAQVEFTKPIKENGNTRHLINDPWLIFLNGVHTWSSVPASATSPGTQGQLAYDQNFVYLCVQKNTWRRVAIAPW